MPPPRLFLFFFFFFFFHAVALGQTPPLPAPQRLASGADLAALFALRSSLGIQSRDWPKKSDPCGTWKGVTCQGGRVTGLVLSGLHRTRLGKVAASFSLDSLRNLTRLSSINSTGFPLPTSIPESFGFGLPPSLAILDLRSSFIVGKIPSSLGSISGLVELHLAGNSLADGIPDNLGQLKNLTVLDLSSNRLTGSVPGSLGLLVNLTVFDLSMNYLQGSIPQELGSLRNLRILSLSDNSLSGSIPATLGDLTSLRVLDLSTNSLMGPLLDDLRGMKSLVGLNLCNNSLTGALRDELFQNLQNLQRIRLSHNNFSGPLPDKFWLLSELLFVDVSFNSLNGSFPDAVVNFNASSAVFNLSHNFYYGHLPSGLGAVVQRLNFFDISNNYFEGVVPFDQRMNASFEFNCFRNASRQRESTACQKFYEDRGMILDGARSSTPTSQILPESSRSNKRTIYIVVGVFSGLLFLALLAALLFFHFRKREAVSSQPKQHGSNGIEGEGDGLTPPVNSSAVGDSFAYAQLLQATSNFSDSNLIKRGHSGHLYRGTLEGGDQIVVKKINVDTVQNESRVVELEFFERASHTRLVPFLGHCLENEIEKFLVYKYMPNMDLSNSLYRKQGPEEEGMKSLDWITRQKIAIGVAEALCYLHHECVPFFVHRDIQTSSILLDDKFEVRLGSLSEVFMQEIEGHHRVMSRFLRPSLSTEASSSSSPSATPAYDVYCFGKVLLELVTGKLGISGSNDAATNNFLEEAIACIHVNEKESLMKIVDPSLIVDDDLMEEVWAIAIVAKSCLNPRSSKRPPMQSILKALENPLKVVRDESFVASARHRTASSRGSWNMGLFGSWRNSSEGPLKNISAIRRSATMGSRGSGGEQSFNEGRPSNENFPEPPTSTREIEG